VNELRSLLRRGDDNCDENVGLEAPLMAEAASSSAAPDN